VVGANPVPRTTGLPGGTFVGSDLSSRREAIPAWRETSGGNLDRVVFPHGIHRRQRPGRWKTPKTYRRGVGRFFSLPKPSRGASGGLLWSPRTRIQPRRRCTPGRVCSLWGVPPGRVYEIGKTDELIQRRKLPIMVGHWQHSRRDNRDFLVLSGKGPVHRFRAFSAGPLPHSTKAFRRQTLLGTADPHKWFRGPQSGAFLMHPEDLPQGRMVPLLFARNFRRRPGF